ncbi:AraC-type DNA-binding protein [Roseateles sp. YR242]|uniref:helix-turn-helix domain-containing protein n=1 Tax=Roseateles sp. YR242 TaxID=1855305 RepID=UPI0008D605B0|nr:AraC family transcriptional regulator [Roseateles sp. YR242]SEL81444.1 AraC-type DNA-binding protein [Roseateles sp. YR242]
MQPFFETVTPEPGASWSFLDRRLPNRIPFEWHHHPEFELTLTLNSRGFRHVGDDISPYGENDLVLMGPGMAHSWCSEEAIDPTEPHVALVCWFTQRWVESLVAAFPEMECIKALLSKSMQGVQFSEHVRNQVAPVIISMRQASPPQRLCTLIWVLDVLRQDSEATCLANAHEASSLDIVGSERMQRVLNYLHANYTKTVRVEQLAEMACVSTSAFHRMFRRQARMTMVNYVMRLRVGRACSLLINSAAPVSVIASEVGYGNLSLFNRQFIRLKGMSPSAFRKSHTSLMSA